MRGERDQPAADEARLVQRGGQSGSKGGLFVGENRAEIEEQTAVCDPRDDGRACRGPAQAFLQRAAAQRLWLVTADEFSG